ncbi:response regulator [Streptomyces sp. NPDC001262]|uniref:response regulator n=1 Tax=unclassified Streptomyces TaxID=2593676 RepID=UPI0036B9EC53
MLIADDAPLVRYGLRSMLDTSDGFIVVGEAADGVEAVTEVRRLSPDLVLMDIRMPRMSGLSALRQIGELPRPPAVVVLTSFALDDYVDEAVAAGAVGFLLKHSPPRELLATVRRIAQGHGALSPEVTRRVLATARDRGPRLTLAQRRLLHRLTDRERDVLALLGTGMSNLRIGKVLGMAEGTTKGHVSRIMAKLDADNRVQAALLAYRAGLSPEGPDGGDG